MRYSESEKKETEREAYLRKCSWLVYMVQEDPLEKETATHSGILPWKIPWTEEPGGLQFMGSQKSHDLVTEQQ